MGSNVSKPRQPGGPKRKSALKTKQGPYRPPRDNMEAQDKGKPRPGRPAEVVTPIVVANVEVFVNNGGRVSVQEVSNQFSIDKSSARKILDEKLGMSKMNDPFGTEIFQPVREEPPPHDEIYPSPRPEAPVERPIPRVHYEDEPNDVGHRDGMVLADTNRMDRSTNPRLSNRPLPGEMDYMETNPYFSPRQYPSHNYVPRPIPRRPHRPHPQQYRGQYSYPYRSLPPSIYPYRPRGPRGFVPSKEMYRVPVPINERYRPVPVLHNSPRVLPVAVPIPVVNRPPPYHSLTHRMPREQPQQAKAEDNITSNQDNVITDRSGVNNGDHSNRDKQVGSLLSPEHLAIVQPAGNLKPKSEESIHEMDDDEYIGANLKFYRNQMKFRPNGETIDYIHKYWYGNYTLLEKLHTYIQWLFPLYESSRVNLDAVPLRAHEAKHICDDTETRNRFLTSFLMMLDFYGFSMADEETGQIERAANWQERFDNLRRSGHDYTRITRILKSLGELGHSKLQTPFVMALFHEVFETQQLAGIPPATLHHWLHSVSDFFEREYLSKQFKKGLTRLDEERQVMKRKDSTKYHFERRKPDDESKRELQSTTRKKPRI